MLRCGDYCRLSSKIWSAYQHQHGSVAKRQGVGLVNRRSGVRIFTLLCSVSETIVSVEILPRTCSFLPLFATHPRHCRCMPMQSSVPFHFLHFLFTENHFLYYIRTKLYYLPQLSGSSTPQLSFLPPQLVAAPAPISLVGESSTRAAPVTEAPSQRRRNLSLLHTLLESGRTSTNIWFSLVDDHVCGPCDSTG